MDSRDLANEVAERMNNEAPMIGGAIHLHAIIREVLEVLKDWNFVDLEDLPDEGS